jgi:hypothetical protein
VKLEAVMVDSSYPIDMSTKDYFIPSTPSPPGVSPPSLTKVENKTPSSPREFFAKLYGPDNPNDTNNEPPLSPQDILTVNPYYTSHSPPPALSFPLPFHPTHPLHHQQGGIVNMEHHPFPGGLAAFCEWFIKHSKISSPTVQ